MQNSASEFQNALPVEVLEKQGNRWLKDCRFRGHTAKSQSMEVFIVEKLLWFLRRVSATECGPEELRDFLLYAAEGHAYPEGRWGNASTAGKKPLSRRAVKSYYSYLKVLFNWIVQQEVLHESPMRLIGSPECQDDNMTAFSHEQINALLEAARRSNQPKRNLAILLFMLDSGARASEVCGTRVGDVDLDERRVSLMGKGQKRREVYIGETSARAVFVYLQSKGRESGDSPHEPLFLSERGTARSTALTTSGLLTLFKRLGKSAGLKATRCHPHMMRRTFASEYLNNGASIKDAQRLMGHTTDKMTMKYLYASDARVRENHRQFSPADRMPINNGKPRR